MYRVLLVLLCLGAVSGEVATPRVGWVRYDTQVRPVYGISGNYVPGPRLPFAAIASGFSSGGGLVQTLNQLYALAPDGHLVATIDVTGDAVIAASAAYMSGKLTRLDGTTFKQIYIQPPAGKILSVRFENGVFHLLSDTAGAVSDIAFDACTGNLISQTYLPDVAAPAIYLGSRVVDAAELGLSAQDLRLETISDRCVHAWSPTQHRHWAVEVTSRGPRVSELPVPAENAE